MDVGRTLERWGGVLVSGFGVKILAGVILEMLSDVTASDAYKCITENLTVSGVNETDWAKYRGFADKANLAKMDWDKLIESLTHQLKVHRSDLYSIIDNTEGGWKWLNVQLQEIRHKLVG
jgi:hypothetical protein